MTPTRAALLAVALLPASAAAVDVTECRQVVRRGDVGELRRDLDCAAQAAFPSAAEGVRLEPGATLEMNGFALRGDGTGVGVGCFGRGGRNRTCTVNGPGTVSGFYAGLNGGGCRMALRGVLLRGNTYGVLGPLACRLVAKDVNAVENVRDGIWVLRLRGRNLVASDNGGAGLVAHRIGVRALLATRNGSAGVRQGTFRGRFGRLRDSTVIANGPGGEGYDIAAAGRLRLRGVRCGRSAKLRYPRPFDGSDDAATVVGSFGCVQD